MDAMKVATEIRKKRYHEHVKKTLKPGKAVKKIGEIARAKKLAHLIRAPEELRQPVTEKEANVEEKMEVN